MLTILNDTHIGVNRVAGTTGRSAQALTDYIHQAFEALLRQADGGHLVILGDLFDQYSVPNSDMVRAFYSLADWCERNKGKQLALVAGNHDLSKDSSRLSSFEFVGVLLQRQFHNVRTILEPALLEDGVYVIPHVRNQDIFNHHLAEVPDGVKYLLLHANYHNGFAEQSDHSLNVSEVQAKEQILKGRTLIFAHEHQRREALGGKVLIPGNQIPTSVSDLLNTEGKYVATIGEDGPKLAQVDLPSLLGVERMLYVERDWRELKISPVQSDAMFIRVIGDASAQEAADVVSRISKYRQHSDAFVITNAVRIEGVEGLEELPATIEAAKGFDVLAAILDTLTEEERKVVHQLLEGSDAALD